MIAINQRNHTRNHTRSHRKLKKKERNCSKSQCAREMQGCSLISDKPLKNVDKEIPKLRPHIYYSCSEIMSKYVDMFLISQHL